jgi:drug/metabolite transporter (DMT)-like permease
VLGPGWTIVVTRAVGVCVVTLPLAAAGRLPRLGRGDPALALVVFSGLAEVGGFVCYLVAAREAVAVAAVLGSQFAAVAAAGSYLLLGERLTRLQLAGSGAILAGVAVISAFQR